EPWMTSLAGVPVILPDPVVLTTLPSQIGALSRAATFQSAPAAIAVKWPWRPGGTSSTPSRSNLFHPTTLPVDVSAKPEKSPADIATTSWRPAGMSVCPCPSNPHPTTVPSDLSARLYVSPAAIATTPVSPAGTSV